MGITSPIPKPDALTLNLAFVKLSLEAVEPGGFVCLVLPQVFLMANNAFPLRDHIRTEFHVRCLVDLTAVTVFEGVGTYSILLVVQRKTEDVGESQAAQIARVQGFVGPALQACLEGRNVKTPYYSTFQVGQFYFQRDAWVLLDPIEVELHNRLGVFQRISQYITVKQGFVLGADDIFIMKGDLIPQQERKIYIDYLPDRQILRYALPRRTDHVFFYPFEHEKLLSENELEKRFPWTWEYLLRNRPKLERRKAATSGETFWWRPVRPRKPQNMRRPKIVCPHLMLTPRFAIDAAGKFAVSHGPFLVTTSAEEELTLLKFFCAVLNSSVGHWYLQAFSPKYGRGYNRVEVALIREFPVPDPAQVSAMQLRKLLDLVDQAMRADITDDLEAAIDDIVADCYGFTVAERNFLIGRD